MKTVKLDPTLMDEEKYAEHKVEEAAETLMEADEIKKDPVLMKKIHEHLKKKEGKIKSLRQLKDKANNYANEQAQKEAANEGSDSSSEQDSEDG